MIEIDQRLRVAREILGHRPKLLLRLPRGRRIAQTRARFSRVGARHGIEFSCAAQCAATAPSSLPRRQRVAEIVPGFPIPGMIRG